METFESLPVPQSQSILMHNRNGVSVCQCCRYIYIYIYGLNWSVQSVWVMPMRSLKFLAVLITQFIQDKDKFCLEQILNSKKKNYEKN